MAVVAALLDEPAPWAWQLKKNRYTPQDEGVRRHADGVLGELAPAFPRQSMAVFLDDSDGNSGALTYVPGSHERHFDRKDAPSPPTQADIYAGSYVPAVLRAGIVVLRVPEVWHAVRPIHRLRRYVTGSYMIRGDLRTEMTKRVVAERDRPRLKARRFQNHHKTPTHHGPPSGPGIPGSEALCCCHRSRLRSCCLGPKCSLRTRSSRDRTIAREGVASGYPSFDEGSADVR